MTLRDLIRIPALVLLPIVGLAVVVGAWQLAIELFDIHKAVLPGPADVAGELVRLRERLYEQSKATLLATLAGFGLTVAGGLLLGTAIASWRPIDRLVSPWLVAFNAIPKVAVAPMLVIWLGFEMQPRVAMVMLICFFPVVLACVTGLRTTPAELVELGRSADASWWRTFLLLRFPHALPQIFIGLKVAMPLALVGAVVGDMSGGDLGLGFVIKNAGAFGRPDIGFAAIAVLAVMGIALFYALVLLERLLLPWVRATSA